MAFLAILIAATISAACGARTYGPARGRPPPSRMLAMTPRPGFVWIQGHWSWRDRWVWEPGSWEPLRPGQAWHPGAWIVVAGRYEWSPGRWAPTTGPVRWSDSGCDTW
jgi:hypothetical protein